MNSFPINVVSSNIAKIAIVKNKLILDGRSQTPRAYVRRKKETQTLLVDEDVDKDLVICILCLSTKAMYLDAEAQNWLKQTLGSTTIPCTRGICKICKPVLRKALAVSARAKQLQEVMLYMSNNGLFNQKNLENVDTNYKSLYNREVKHYGPNHFDIFYVDYTIEDEIEKYESDVKQTIKDEIVKYESDLDYTEVDYLESENDDDYKNVDEEVILNCQLAVSNDQPIDSNDQPIVSNYQPIDSIDQRKVSNDQPIVSNDQCKVSNDQPTVSKDQPKVLNDQPILSDSQSDDDDDDYLESNEEEMIFKIPFKGTEENKVKSNNNVILLKKWFSITRTTPEEQRENIIKVRMTQRYKNAEFKCTECYEWFGSKTSCDKHFLDHKNPNYKICDICFKRFKTYHYEAHLRRHENNRYKYSCKVCSFVTLQRFGAQTHMNLHEGKKNVCEICGKIFNRFSNLATHVRNVHPTDKTCRHCGQTFISEVGLRVHTRRVHKDEDAVPDDQGPKCEDCDITFKDMEALNTHLFVSFKHGRKNIVKGVRRTKIKNPDKTDVCEPVICDQCGQTFKSTGAYRVHCTKSHGATPKKATKEKVLCPICGCKVANLYIHKYRHNAQMVQCQICEKWFRGKFYLYNHMLIHGEPQFACPTCGKKFKSRSNMFRHANHAHTSERNVKCEMCDKYYKNKEMMKSHMMYVHMNKPWPRKVKKGLDKKIKDELDNFED